MTMAIVDSAGDSGDSGSYCPGFPLPATTFGHI